MVRRLVILILVILSWCSCKRLEEPKDEYSTPYFFINGILNDQTFEINAGENSWYLSTQNQIDSIQVYCFTGEFKENCQGCKRKFKLLIRNYKDNSLGTFFNRDSAVVNGKRQFFNRGEPTIKAIQFQFNGKDTGNNLQHNWYHNGNKLGNAKSIDIKLTQGELHHIKYQILNPLGCSSEITLPIKIDSAFFGWKLPDFEVEPIDKLPSMFRFKTNGNFNSSYYWDFGNGAKAQGISVSYGYAQAGNYLVNLMVVTKGDTLNFSKWVKVKQHPDCISNFNVTAYPILDYQNLSTIQIEYTDEQGITYSSSAIGQNRQSYFVVDESYDYIKNEKGQLTRMVSFRLNCKLSSGFKVIDLKNVKAKMAVAI